MNRTTKQAWVAARLAEMHREVEVLTAAARSTHEAATHEENRAENDKDTRAIEAGYLAGAQADRVRELQAAITAFESMGIRDFAADGVVGTSALVTLECDGVRSRYFFAPQGGGRTADFDGGPVQVITPKSPLGSALLGKRVGDVVEVQTQKKLREYEIVGLE